jgi:hypothetical protein
LYFVGQKSVDAQPAISVLRSLVGEWRKIID